MEPSSKRASENGVVREPSAPKNSKPAPTSTPCKATATINKISTEASANGRNTKRYNSGPNGVINTSVVNVCSHNDCGRSPSTSAVASNGKPRHQNAVATQFTSTPCFQRQPSTTNTTKAKASSSHNVAGVAPVCSMTMVKAPKATNSPCGIKITRVTENTRTSANAIRPYTAPLTMPSCPSSRAIWKSIFVFLFAIQTAPGAQQSLGARNLWMLLYYRFRQSGLVLPGAVFNFHHHTGALIQPQVVGGRHGEDAVCARHLFEAFQRIAHGHAELGRTRFGLFQGLWHSSGHEHPGVPTVRAKGGNAAFAMGGFVGFHIRHGRGFHGVVVGQLIGHQHGACRQQRAFHVFA